VPPRQSYHVNKGTKRYDEDYSCSLMSLSVNAVAQSSGEIPKDACRAELEQLFHEKNTLVPVN
jgi:hypothetical protein